jgi:hypothetical protein
MAPKSSREPWVTSNQKANCERCGHRLHRMSATITGGFPARSADIIGGNSALTVHGTRNSFLRIHYIRSHLKSDVGDAISNVVSCISDCFFQCIVVHTSSS